MKSLVDLLEAILLDSGMECDADPSLDFRTVKRRVEAEGVSFLTITLPAFCQAFERALEDGRLLPCHLPGFRFSKKTGLPRFLGGFLRSVFDGDGCTLNNPSVVCIRCIRQICLFAKKIELPCTTQRLNDAADRFVECDNEVPCFPGTFGLAETFRQTSRILWSEIFKGVPYGNPYEDLKPKHGPGKTVERRIGNSKFHFPNWHLRLESRFPFTEFGIGSVRNYGLGATHFDEVDFVEPGDEAPSKVALVPKTMKTPRVIAIEPVCMQYIQQAILGWLVPRIENSRYTRGHVNFRDQRVNANLALSSSKDKRHATIDLSEASDRVSLDLVVNMLAVVPDFLDSVLSCRTTRSKLPDGRIVHLRKFASMGSALCFPIEAMVFYTIAVSGLLQSAGTRVTPASIRKYGGRVYVYGDDIIVPVDAVSSTVAALEYFGLKVNGHKTFSKGNFRESCGMDAYAGEDVTPVYLRRTLPCSRADVSALISTVSTANQFYRAGYWRTFRMLRDRVNRILGDLPFFGGETLQFGKNHLHDVDGSPGLAWVSYSKAHTFKRWNKDLQRLENRYYFVKPKRYPDPLDGDSALLKCFGLIGSSDIDPLHLERSVQSGNCALQRRWAT